MTTDQWLVVANLGTVVVAMVTVFFGLKGVRDQLRTATFLAYTKRYGKIMRRLPLDARRPGGKFHLHELSEPERRTCSRRIRTTSTCVPRNGGLPASDASTSGPGACGRARSRR